jgi:hypothetical protein
MVGNSVRGRLNLAFELWVTAAFNPNVCTLYILRTIVPDTRQGTYVMGVCSMQVSGVGSPDGPFSLRLLCSALAPWSMYMSAWLAVDFVG